MYATDNCWRWFTIRKITIISQFYRIFQYHTMVLMISSKYEIKFKFHSLQQHFQTEYSNIKVITWYHKLMAINQSVYIPYNNTWSCMTKYLISFSHGVWFTLMKMNYNQSSISVSSGNLKIRNKYLLLVKNCVMMKV